MVSNEQIQRIKGVDFDTLKKDSNLTMLLIRCYSKLFTGGEQLRTCERFLKRYYDNIKNIKIMRTKDDKNKLKRKEFWINTGAQMTHIMRDFLTDEKAILFLNAKFLKPEQFEILPEGYSKEAQKKDTKRATKKVKAKK